MKPNIVFLDEYTLGGADLTRLHELGRYTGYSTTAPDEVADRCRDAEIAWEQRSEIDTEAYWGGAVYAQHCSVHPARYHQGLLQRHQYVVAKAIAQQQMGEGLGFFLGAEHAPHGRRARH